MMTALFVDEYRRKQEISQGARLNQWKVALYVAKDN
jgi:hypothetical protein